jgi:hypothetical protein
VTTTTLRPTSTPRGGTATTTGGASPHDVTDDDNDATYFELPTTGTYVNLGITSTLPTGAVLKSATVRCRAKATSNLSLFKLFLRDHLGGQTFGEYWATIPSSFDERYSSAPLNPSPHSDQDFLDNLRLGFETTTSANYPVRIAEAYLDLTYVTKPTVSVGTVATPITDSSYAEATFTATLDADGGPVAGYRVKTFSAAQYGAGGFDPATSDAVASVNEIGASESVSMGPLPDDTTYKHYVQVYQIVNGSIHATDWTASNAFAINIDSADVDTITATAVDASGKITVDVAHDGTSEAWEYIEVQRSIDGKATWQDVRFATYVDCTADTDDFAVDDYEVANGVDAWYRARATYMLSSEPITGDWVETSAAESWSSTDTWLKSPTDPTLNVTLAMEQGQPSRTDPRQAGVFDVLPSADGEAVPPSVVVFAGGRSSRVYLARTYTAAERLELKALIVGGFVLLDWSSDDPTRGAEHLAITSHTEAEMVPHYSPLRTWMLFVTEVDAPADPTAGR